LTFSLPEPGYAKGADVLRRRIEGIDPPQPASAQFLLFSLPASLHADQWAHRHDGFIGIPGFGDMSHAINILFIL